VISESRSKERIKPGWSGDALRRIPDGVQRGGPAGNPSLNTLFLPAFSPSQNEIKGSLADAAAALRCVEWLQALLSLSLSCLQANCSIWHGVIFARLARSFAAPRLEKESLTIFRDKKNLISSRR